MEAKGWAVVMAILLTGCDSAGRDDTGQGELRHQLFVECMELAAKIPRTQDDDVHKIISECQSSSWYLSNHIYTTRGGKVRVE